LKENLTMLRLAVVFFVIALIAAFFGFGFVANYSYVGTNMAMAEGAGEWAKILSAVSLILAVLALLGHRFRRRVSSG
jgi:uncharacterized membrane protein YtjA (UPF0391 family)